MNRTLIWLMRRDVVSVNGVYHLKPGFHTVGRCLKCDIHLDDLSVSRVHAIVVLAGDALLVRDMASLNGTYVNEVRVCESSLVLGDCLRLGRVALDVTAGSEGMAPLDLCDGTLPASDLTPDRRPRLDRLTQGQGRVLRLLLSGLSEKQIAARLVLSRHTIHNHIKAIYRTLGVHSHPELMALWLSEPEQPGNGRPAAANQKTRRYRM